MLYIYKYMYIFAPNILSTVYLPPKISTDLKNLLNFDEFRVFNSCQKQILRCIIEDYKLLSYWSLILCIDLSNYLYFNKLVIASVKLSLIVFLTANLNFPLNFTPKTMLNYYYNTNGCYFMIF